MQAEYNLISSSGKLFASGFTDLRLDEDGIIRSSHINYKENKKFRKEDPVAWVVIKSLSGELISKVSVVPYVHLMKNDTLDIVINIRSLWPSLG